MPVFSLLCNVPLIFASHFSHFAMLFVCRSSWPADSSGLPPTLRFVTYYKKTSAQFNLLLLQQLSSPLFTVYLSKQSHVLGQTSVRCSVSIKYSSWMMCFHEKVKKKILSDAMFFVNVVRSLLLRLCIVHYNLCNLCAFSYIDL